uniref:Mixed-linked glucanase n=1 Tax=Ganoderma boninense TaxID=34458 RepID=A0A5K1K8D7_9APHY|nr:Mixed-linked glucanase [Ganoderma boninense]
MSSIPQNHSRKRRASSSLEGSKSKAMKLHSHPQDALPLQIWSPADTSPPTPPLAHFSDIHSLSAPNVSSSSFAPIPSAPHKSMYDLVNSCKPAVDEPCRPLPLHQPVHPDVAPSCYVRYPLKFIQWRPLHPPDVVLSPATPSVRYGNPTGCSQSGSAGIHTSVSNALTPQLQGTPSSPALTGLSTQSWTSTAAELISHTESRYEECVRRDSAGEHAGQLNGERTVKGNASCRANPRGTREKNHPAPSNERGSHSDHGNGVPQEYQVDLERIFFEFLNIICSDLDATDSEGGPIHQKYMEKTMLQMQEWPGFRPFKFRIQAFINAFMEELARQGHPSDIISAKQVKIFLFSQPYIARFNEKGKKTKSKGSHVWHIKAKRTDDRWTFQRFTRKLTGTASPHRVAFIGTRWTWTPRIWDPQVSHTNAPVYYSSPSLPQWLSWSEYSLTGIPPREAMDCDVVIEARIMEEGKEELLTSTVRILVAPLDDIDWLLGKKNDAVDAVPVPPFVEPKSQVSPAVTGSVQRAAMGAETHATTPSNLVWPTRHAAAKENRTTTNTFGKMRTEIPRNFPEYVSASSDARKEAIQQVILQATLKLLADRIIHRCSGFLPADAGSATFAYITAAEISTASLSAVAEAMDMVGPQPNEVDVLLMAGSLLQDRTRTALYSIRQPGGEVCT